MYMPSLDRNFGNSVNHKRARIIEHACYFDEDNFIVGIQSESWNRDPGFFSLAYVSFELFNMWAVCLKSLRSSCTTRRLFRQYPLSIKGYMKDF